MALICFIQFKTRAKTNINKYMEGLGVLMVRVVWSLKRLRTIIKWSSIVTVVGFVGWGLNELGWRGRAWSLDEVLGGQG